MTPDPKALRVALLDFFDARARPLPWRETSDPYAIWVSEIMLQQTRVETVIPYWERWMALFPDVEALAAAAESEVLKAWEGLGYYSRARNLRAGAAVVRDRFGGRLPEAPEALREVPGIGPYTAGAVASIAYGVATPAVDGNVRRVLARLFDEPKPTDAWLRDRARELVDPDRPGDFNQALMELGATVCTPRSPTCTGCPVATACAARAAGTVEERPAPKQRKPVPERVFAVRVDVVVGAGGRWKVRMRQRPSEGLLGGMWEFPSEELADASRGGAPGVEVSEGSEAGRREGEALEPVTHLFSHFRAEYRPRLRVANGSEVLDVKSDRWVGEEEIASLALPVAQQKIAGLLRARMPKLLARRRDGS